MYFSSTGLTRLGLRRFCTFRSIASKLHYEGRDGHCMEDVKVKGVSFHVHGCYLALLDVVVDVVVVVVHLLEP